jgi:O-antigen ligase
MLIGFETFINNPIIGIGYYRVYFESVSEVLKLPIGHHSHFIDSIGRFGILGLFMLFLELSRWRRYSLVFTNLSMDDSE